MSIINSTNLHVGGNRNETTIQPITMEYVEAEKFDRSKLMELAAAGDIDKVKEYLDKCGITYIIDNKSDPNKTIIMADEIEVYIHKSSSTEPTTTTSQSLNNLVTTKIDVWVNDFKTGYTRWGLSSEPTEAQIKTFREALTAACADTSVISDKSDKGVHDWVRGQANIAIAQVKYNAYTEKFTDNFTKNFAKYGFDSALTDEELATVKSEFEKLYKAEVKEHVETINKYEGVHQVESIEVWYNELLNKALQQVKTARAVKANGSKTDEVFKEMPNVNESSPDKTEKAETTRQNLLDLYEIYRPAMQKIQSYKAGFLQQIVNNELQKLNDKLQEYIDNNNLDISLDNLKLFFSDVMDKQQNYGVIGSTQYLIIRFDDYIKNGYTLSLNKSNLHSSLDELYKDYSTSLGNDNSETSSLTGAATGNFDFSVVTGYNSQFASFYKEPSSERLVNSTSLNVIDKGFWDNALEALDKLKPQLHEYIKAQMQNKGLKHYNHDTVDKILNTFISQAVSSAIVASDFPSEIDLKDPYLASRSFNTPIGGVTRSLEMSSIVNTLLTMVDNELGIDSKYEDLNGSKALPHDAPNAFKEENQYRTLYYSSLVSTCDKYLSEEEKLLKLVLVGLTIDDSIRNGQTNGDKMAAEKVVDLYSDHVKLYLKSHYGSLSDEKILTILNEVKNDTLQDSVIESFKNSNGSYYNLEALVLYFGEKAESLAKIEEDKIKNNV